MKLDMGQAWSQAMAMLSANRDLVAIVAGVFFFLPYLAVLLMLPDLVGDMPQLSPNADPDAVMAALQELLSRIWLPILVLGLVQAIGSLTLLALLRDAARPTLGEALKLGLVAFLPYLAAQLLGMLAVALGGGILVGLASAAHALLGVIVMLFVLVGAIYLWTKWLLTMPVIAVERVYNPLAAMRRSWRLTKGNSLLLFAFYMLLVIAGVIVITVIEMIFGLVFALFGAQAQLIGDSFVSGVLNAIWATILVAVLAAVHRQLASGKAEAPGAPDGAGI
jgi:hypothetical protein